MVYVLPDGSHMHPRVLGGGQLALYAGDLVIERGNITELTNLSGTFQFDDEAGLLDVADACERQGVAGDAGAVRFFPSDGSRPVILR